MKNIMSVIFTKLIEFSLEYDDYDVDYDLLDVGRYIKSEDPIDHEYLKHTNLCSEIFHFNSNQVCFLLKYKNENYFVLITQTKIINLPFFLCEIDTRAGLVASAIYHSGTKIKKDLPKNTVYNKIPFQHVNQQDYEGHSIDEILDLLYPINIYKINDHQKDILNLEQILGAVIALNDDLVSIDLSKETLIEFANAFQFGSNIIPYDNLLNSLLSNSFEHSFLELYKCIESLFQVIYTINLYNEIKPHCTLMQFLESIDVNLKWRPVEHISVKSIIKDSPDSILEKMKEVSGKDKTKTKLGDWFYEIRNRIVHLKQLQKKVAFNSDDWNKLIYCSLRLIEFWFKKYENDLCTASKKIYAS